MKPKTFLLELSELAKILTNEDERAAIRSAADNIRERIFTFYECPTTDNLSNLQCAWSHAMRLHANIKRPPGATPPTPGTPPTPREKEATNAQAA